MRDNLLTIQNVLNNIDDLSCCLGLVDTTPAYAALVRLVEAVDEYDDKHVDTTLTL